jgi:outer membrane murein-binding lipoprotein Lpp
VQKKLSGQDWVASLCRTRSALLCDKSVAQPSFENRKSLIQCGAERRNAYTQEEMMMLSPKLVVGAIALAGMVTVIGGCDQSKAELDSTKTQLASVTSERDSLKTQLDAANKQVQACQQQVTQLQAAQAAPPPAAAPAAPEPKEHKGKHEGKTPTAAAPPAAPPAAPAPTPAQQKETARKQRGAM